MGGPSKPKRDAAMFGVMMFSALACTVTMVLLLNMDVPRCKNDVRSHEPARSDSEPRRRITSFTDDFNPLQQLGDVVAQIEAAHRRGELKDPSQLEALRGAATVLNRVVGVTPVDEQTKVSKEPTPCPPCVADDDRTAHKWLRNIDAIHERSIERLQHAESAERARLAAEVIVERKRAYSADTLHQEGVRVHLDEDNSNWVQQVDIDPWNQQKGVYIWDWFPATYTCVTRERIGAVGDGGKWICDIDSLRQKPSCVLYSYGVRDDVSFESEMFNRTGCKVHAFDPTVAGLPLNPATNSTHYPGITFYKQALSPTSGPTRDFLISESFEDTMARLGHSHVDILKVDIEGSEWDVFKDLLSSRQTPLPVDQLLIELHFHNVSATFEFFRNMQREGFRVFSQEANLQPCMVGNKPVAVEFSFIRPEPLRVLSPTLQPKQQEPVNGAIFSLVQTQYIPKLLTMLASLDRHFNNRFNYPVVLFTEGVDEEARREIAKGTNSKVHFYDVYTLLHKLPASVNSSNIPEHTPCGVNGAKASFGYRHMCRFQAFEANQLMTSLGYEWHMRLDDDSLFTEDINYDLFQMLASNGKRYAYVNTVEDDENCIEGLWDAADYFVSERGLNGTFFQEWPRGRVFYNNFEVSHKSVWESEMYQAWSSEVDQLGGIFYKRWGDAPIKTIGLALVVPATQVHQFTDLAYTHAPFTAQSGSGLPHPSRSIFDFGSLNTTGSSAMVSQHVLHELAATIFTITKGSNTTLLLRMLRSFEEHFAKATQYRYPVVIFCEEVPQSAKQSLSEVLHSRLVFVDTQFTFPAVLNTTSDPASSQCARQSSLGYRHVARFLAGHAHKVLSNMGFQWHWLLHADSELTAEVGYDVFEMMARKGKRYGFVASLVDNPDCVTGAWEAADRLLLGDDESEDARKVRPGPGFYGKWPRGRVFYNNFEVGHRSMWESEPYRAWLEAADRASGVYVSRWSSAVLTTIGVAMALEAHEVHQFSDLGYSHAPFVHQLGRFSHLLPSARHPVSTHILGRPFATNEDLTLNARFAHSGEHGVTMWSGGDVATSVPIDEHGAAIWLFGDSLLSKLDKGRRVATSLVHGSVAYFPSPSFSSDGGEGVAAGSGVSTVVAALIKNTTHFPSEIQGTVTSVTPTWTSPATTMPDPMANHNALLRFETEVPSLFSDRSGGGETGIFYWVVAGLVTDWEEGSGEGRKRRLVILAQRVKQGASFQGIFGFQVQGTSAFVIEGIHLPPSQWRMLRRCDVPGTNAMRNWFSGIALRSGAMVARDADEEVLLIGSKGDGNQALDTQTLGRLTAGQLVALNFSALEEMTPLLEPQAGLIDQYGVHAQSELSLYWHAGIRAWCSLFVEVGTAQVVLRTAHSLKGPWTSTVVYSIPAPWNDPRKYYVYAVKAHPELVRGINEIVFTYIVTSKQGVESLESLADARLYVPRFVRLVVDPEVGVEELTSASVNVSVNGWYGSEGVAQAAS